MWLKLRNNFKQKTDSLNLEELTEINIYLCGPTVYDHVHVGNLRPVIIFDVLIKVLQTLKKNIFYVHNITDIDDKIVNRAYQENKTEKEISEYFIKSYKEVLTNYNIDLPNSLPLVTDYIDRIKEFISFLLENNYAYLNNGDVIFNTKDFLLSENKSIKYLQELKNVRKIITNSLQIGDFVLWKSGTNGIKWQSPWGEGRPGWHTECVVFIQNLFNGNPLTIHGGGQDLLFPHHYNENIQYLAFNKRDLSYFWCHVNYVLFEKQKMSKSLGNVWLAKDFYSKYGSNVFRYIVLTTHYRQTIDLNFNLVEQACNYLKKIKNLEKRLQFFLYCSFYKIIKYDKLNININSSFFQNIITILLDDLDTAKIFLYLEELINNLNIHINKNKIDDIFWIEFNRYHWLIDLLGFSFPLPDYNQEVKELIKKWLSLKALKQYELADEYRYQLQRLDII